MDGFRRGRDAKIAEYGANPWPYAAPAADNAAPYETTDAPAEDAAPPEARADELEEKRRLLADLADYADQLKARVAELEDTLRAQEAELKEKRRLLANLTNFAEQLKAELEAMPDTAPLQARIAELEDTLRARDAELAEKRRLLIELATLAEQLKAQLAAMPEDAAKLCADVLRLPGVEKILRSKFHPDMHPKDRDDAAKWQAWNEATQKINAAYDAIKVKRRPLGE